MEKQTLKKLISLARQDTPPCVDVAETVIARLSAMTQPGGGGPYRVYLWTGIASAVIAAGIIVAATITWQSGGDSVGEMMNMVSWVTQ